MIYYMCSPMSPMQIHTQRNTDTKKDMSRQHEAERVTECKRVSQRDNKNKYKYLAEVTAFMTQTE